MKKIFLAASLFAATISYAGTTQYNHAVYKSETEGGRHIAESSVPSDIVNMFYSQYPGSRDVRWEVEREHGQKVYKAQFRLNGQRMSAKYFA